MGELEKLAKIWGDADLLQRLIDGGGGGVPEIARAFTVAGLVTKESPLMLVVPRSRDAESFADELSAWLPRSSVVVFPAWEVLPGEAMSPTLEVMGRRIRIIRDLAAGKSPPVVVASVRAFLQRVPPPQRESIVLKPGATASLDDLANRLIEFGFERNYLVERSGEFSIRGGILDVYPPGYPHPLRADFFGDEITSLREFFVSSQRSLGESSEAEILPTREFLLTEEVRKRARELTEGAGEGRASDLDRIAAGVPFPGVEAYLAELVDDLEPPATYLGSGRVVVADPKLTRDRATNFLEQVEEWSNHAGGSALFSSFDEAFVGDDPIELWSFRRGEEGLDLDVRAWDDFTGRPHELARELIRLRSEGATVVVAAGRATERAQEVLGEADLALPIKTVDIGAAVISEAHVERGFILNFPDKVVLAVVGEADLFGRRRVPQPPAVSEGPARAAALLLELGQGDFIVHELYGVGRYHGMVTRDIAGVSRDYLLIEYAGDDKLYVPTEQLDSVTKYAGGDSPRLNRLGSGEWEKAKSRARRAVKDIAEELVVLYAKRAQSKGHAFGPDTPWQRQLEDSFPYVETYDQMRAIDDVKADLERPIPMDRLICGDVGYGKTEIAVRAAFKAVQDSKQVAVLVPTTILAQQHTQTFKERFASFPIEVVSLSRFLTDKEQDEAIERLAAGRADVVIGTHRLIQHDVKFHDLGLLIVDEEQRFGVKHKERIKQMRSSIDVMTLSATPIPRTLELSLTGIRDMSLVDTPPADRRPVLTYVGPSDERMITASIRRELARDGQVFYVHNRVRSIKRAARIISALVPGARVEIAHGQMSESQLERVMIDVWDGKIDVLVCTTIIESGLDIPTMNTLIVERADLLGLAQLYQLRGRVGRAGERAYAYFLYPDETVLTDEAHERLKTLSEFTELGSGFKIALKDLEIRGAGNILGAEQSGHVAAVGFDLYVRMMAEQVQKLAGEEPEKAPELRIDLPVDAFIPASYIARESLRIEAYRRIERARTKEEVEALSEELTDRYGQIPGPVQNLLLVAELRALAIEHGINEVTARDGIVKARPFPALDEAQQVRVRRLYPKATVKDASSTLLIPAPAQNLVSWVVDAVRAILA